MDGSMPLSSRVSGCIAAPPTTTTTATTTATTTTTSPTFSVVADVRRMQGRRAVQEDRHVLIEDLHEYVKNCGFPDEKTLPPIQPACLFALFDGHMGHLASEYCSKHLPLQIAQELLSLPSLFSRRSEVAEKKTQATESPQSGSRETDGAEGIEERSSKRRKLVGEKSSTFPGESSSSAEHHLVDPEHHHLVDPDHHHLVDPDHHHLVDPEHLNNPAPSNWRAGSPNKQPDDELNIDAIGSCIHNAFTSVDKNFMQKYRLNKDGSTALITLILGRSVFVAWVGDSRSVLGSERQMVFPQTENSNPQLVRTSVTVPGATLSNRWSCSDLSDDHRPSRPDELTRIQKAGGIVLSIDGVARVARADFELECRKVKQALSMGTPAKKAPVALAVARSIGDREFKQPDQPLVSSIPEVRHVLVKPEDRVIVMACDGIFDVLSPQEVVQVAQSQDSASLMESAGNAASTLVKKAFQKGSADNLTAIVIRLDIKAQPKKH